MNADRRAQLEKNAGRRLAAAFRKVLKPPAVASIDIEMFWPPDHDGLHFLVQADKTDIDWDFSIPTAAWRQPTDAADEVPSGLEADIRHLFRTKWKEVSASSPDTRAYLRLHDSPYSVDLRNGRCIDDRDRPDYKEPHRQTVKKRGRSTKRKRRNGELIRRDDALSRVKKAYQLKQDPDATLSQYYWPDRGIRIQIQNGKVYLVVYFDPFPDSVAGIWIGAHAWEVEEILGRAKAEHFTSTGRLWQYDVDGFMSVSFDRKDRVDGIIR